MIVDEFVRVPCVIMRGGTSKGIYLKENHLPVNKELRDKYILAIFGSPDIRQIDGLGGADPLTSKVAIIGASTMEGADVDYTFGQVSINKAYIDYSGNCGNISSGVGGFAIDEGLVSAVEPITTVRIHNTNTGKILVAEVPVINGRGRISGDCAIDGVSGTGAEILMDFSGTAGSTTGKILPTGNPTDTIATSRGDLEISVVDVANTCVFIRATDIGMIGNESPTVINSDKGLLDYLEEVRAKAAVLAGMAPDEKTASEKYPAFPMIAFVGPRCQYEDFTTGKTITADRVDFVSRMMFMQVLHKTYPGTGTACTGAAAKLNGTIVNQMIPHIDSITQVNIGHPAGVIPVTVEVIDGQLTKAAFGRTARRIMDGYVYIESEKLKQLK